MLLFICRTSAALNSYLFEGFGLPSSLQLLLFPGLSPFAIEFLSFTCSLFLLFPPTLHPLCLNFSTLSLSLFLLFSAFFKVTLLPYEHFSILF